MTAERVDRRTTARPRPRWVLLLAVVGTALTWIVLSSSPATAHTRLVATDPVDGARFATPPARVSLTFDGQVHMGTGTVRVFASTGKELATDAGQPPDRRNVVEAALPRLAPGTYTVAWRVIGTDADPESGTFSFTIAPADAPTPTRPRAPTSPTPDVDGAASGDGVGAARAVSRFVGFAAMILLVAIALDATILRPTRTLTTRARLLAVLSGSMLVVTSVLAVTIGAAHAAGAGLAQAMDSDIVRPFLETTPARAAIVRGALAIGVLVSAVVPHRASRQRTRAIVAAVAIVIVGTFAASGHAISGTYVHAAFLADLVHLFAVGVWIGGLVALLVLGGRSDERAVRRFSTVAAWSVALIVASGLFAAWRQLGTVDTLTTTDYGRTLIVKLALVGALLTLGSMSRRVVRRWWFHNGLARLVMAETVVAGLVLAATTALVSTTPGRLSDPSPALHAPASADRDR